MPPAAAAAALRAADRRVCFLTHAWRCCVHPDPDGATLAALLRLLRDPLGAHVVGVFVDFACLPQWPRTAEQEAHRTGIVSNVLGNLHRMPAARSITTEVSKSVRLLIDPGRADQAGSNAAMVLTYRTKVSVTPVRR